MTRATTTTIYKQKEIQLWHISRPSAIISKALGNNIKGAFKRYGVFELNLNVLSACSPHHIYVDANKGRFDGFLMINHCRITNELGDDFIHFNIGKLDYFITTKLIIPIIKNKKELDYYRPREYYTALVYDESLEALMLYYYPDNTYKKLSDYDNKKYPISPKLHSEYRWHPK